MPYRFELTEKIAPAFGRIASEQIDRVIRDLTASKTGDVAVHESRKSLKRTRALLRLVRPGIPDAAFKASNAALRDIAQSFSADRDRHVLSAVAVKCGTEMSDRFSKPLAVVHATLQQQPDGQGNGHAAARDKAIADLAAARKTVLALSPKPNSFDVLQAGLRDSYRRGRQQIKRVYAHPTDEGFHDLRKSVQQHWRHMQVLQRAWPDLFAARLSAARRLSQILGDDHDLAVFKLYVDGLQNGSLSQASRQAIVTHCIAEQAKLRRLAHPLLLQLYAEKAGRFSRHIAEIWRTSVRAAVIENAGATVPAKKPAAAPARAAKGSAKAKDARRPPVKTPRRGNSTQARPAS